MIMMVDEGVVFAAYSYDRLLFSITLIIIIIHPTALYVTIYLSLFPTSSQYYPFLLSYLFLCVLFLIVRLDASLYSMLLWT